MDDQITVRLPTSLESDAPANIPPTGAPAIGRRSNGARGVPSGSATGRRKPAERVEELYRLVVVGSPGPGGTAS